MATPEILRPDFNNALVHLTRDRRDYRTGKKMSAFQVLKKILKDGRLIGSGNSGYVKGTRTAVCLTEIPLSGVRFYASDEPGAKYSFYGLALSKQAAFETGGRPVIYLPDDEADWIPEQEKWRHVRFEHGKVDFTHEREWRIPGDLDLTTVPGVYVLVWSVEESRRIREMKTPVAEKIRGIFPMKHLTQML